MTQSKRDLMEQAVCTQHDPDIWHYDDTEAQAISLCLHGGPGGSPCPALAVCLDISTDPENHLFTKDGVWGGMNSHKRARLRANRVREDRNQTVTFTATNRRTTVRDFIS